MGDASCEACGELPTAGLAFKPIGLAVRCPHCGFDRSAAGRPLFWHDPRAGKLVTNLTLAALRYPDVADVELIREVSYTRFVNHILMFGKESPLAWKQGSRLEAAGLPSATDPFRMEGELPETFVLRCLFLFSIHDGFTAEAKAWLDLYLAKVANAPDERDQIVLDLMRAQLCERYGSASKALAGYLTAYQHFKALGEVRLQLCAGMHFVSLNAWRKRYEQSVEASETRLVESGAVASMPIVQECLQLARAQQSPVDRMLLRAYLALALLDGGRQAEAAELLSSLRQECGTHWRVAYEVLCAASLLSSAEGAVVVLRQATALGSKLVPFWLEARAWILLGEAYRNQQETGRASSALRTALDRWEWSVSLVHVSEARARLRAMHREIREGLISLAMARDDAGTVMLAVESGLDRRVREFLAGASRAEPSPSVTLLAKQDLQLRIQIHSDVMAEFCKQGDGAKAMRELFHQPVDEKTRGFGLESVPTRAGRSVNEWRNLQRQLDEHRVLDGMRATSSTIRLLQRELAPDALFLLVHPLDAHSNLLLAVNKSEVRLQRQGIEDVRKRGTATLASQLFRKKDLRLLFKVRPNEEGSTSDEDWREAATASYSVLFALVDDLIDRARHLIVCQAAGGGSAIPMTVMCRNGQYLVQTHRLSFVSSVSTWLHLKNAWADSPAPSSIASFGNPKVDAVVRRVAPEVFGKVDLQLPGAEAEVRRIHHVMQRFAHRRCYVGNDATADLFLQELQRADVVHLACHGIFTPNEPRLSLLLLAPSEARPLGIVDASDLLSGEVRARIVTLSGCNTALTGGPTLDAEGFVSALLACGVSSVTAARWAVDDEAATELMEAYYTRLPDCSPAEALRKAQLELMKMPPYAHPYFWGTYRLSGYSP